MATTSPVKTEQLHGTVKTVTFANPENGYFVAKVTVEGKGERTVVGNAPIINVGEHLSALGTWHTSNWGPQFKASDVTLSEPTMLADIERYLAGAFEGIGKGFAKKMVAAFGEAIFEVIEKTPKKLNDVPGIGKKRAESIVKAYSEQSSVREIMVFLYRSGLSSAKATKVYEKYGERAIQTIKENPYCLCKDIWGIGFSKADAVAQKQGIPLDSEYRVCAGIHHVINEAVSSGSCGLPLVMVREKVSEMLNVPYDLVDSCIEFELSSMNLVKDTAAGDICLFPPGIYGAERNIAQKLLAMSSKAPAKVLHDIPTLVDYAQVESGILLEPTQREAVHIALASNVCVLTGGPGTGKTTITKILIQVLMENGLKALSLCAPTGKAAKRASEATNLMATTVHRLLGVGRKDGAQFNEKNPLPIDVLIVDEWSMADVRLMDLVCKALPATARLLMVGDVDQIPSVGPGKVLKDIIDSGAIPTVKLKTIFRQAATSDIIKNAHLINNGEMPEAGWKEGSDFCFMSISPKDRDDEELKKQCREKIETEVLRVARDMYKRGFDPIREVQVLAPMRRGILGVLSLNVRLQAILNPHPEAFLEAMGTKWCVGDKVMQQRNNYDKMVFNGDVGYVVAVDKDTRSVSVEFDEAVVTYKSGDLDELTLAYAFTIHKSQGSEFPVVIMPFDWSHYTMLKRNLLYTGVTRARKLCVIIGQPAAARVAVTTAQNDDRYSLLKEHLQKGLPRELMRA